MDHVIDRLGGTVAVARMCRVSAPSASNWRKRGIPIERCLAIERANVHGIRRWDLRPLDWHLIWPELVGVVGAPSVAANDASVTVVDAVHAPNVHGDASHSAPPELGGGIPETRGAQASGGEARDAA